MDNKSASLVADFQKYFDLQLATTPSQLENVYRLRYRVYCEEFQYEPAKGFPGQLENDDFDAISMHCLVVHKATGMPAGCSRLVLADEQSLLPMEKFCSSVIDEGIIRAFDGRRHTICEFSRLAVDGAFRRRPGERATRFGVISADDCSAEEQRTFPLIALATILSLFALSELIDRPYCFAMMERFLPRLCLRFGIEVKPAGGETDYHGTRSPYCCETRQALEAMALELQEFYAVIRASFAASGVLAPGRIIV